VSPVLRVEGLTAGYGGVPVVQDVSLEVRAGQIVGLLGPNGAGKTTTLLTIGGALRPLRGRIEVLGGPTAEASLRARVRRGMGLLTDDRSVFSTLTVRENLRLGSGDPAAALEVFPELRPLLRRRAGLLSGGEQQMLGLGRILAARPRLLLADELSLGLAPEVVGRLYPAIRALAAEGCAVLLVEQQVRLVLDIADHAHVLAHGAVRLCGSTADLAARPGEIESSYLAGG